ncbi:MAG TPA: hypothetical protein VIM70_08195 [Clostridium sp.]|uniref:hypothetical protein n=1 Tax=Clostridium sp. TaxID=1506 RepID=UPI002F92BD00
MISEEQLRARVKYLLNKQRYLEKDIHYAEVDYIDISQSRENLDSVKYELDILHYVLTGIENESMFSD